MKTKRGYFFKKILPLFLMMAAFCDLSGSCANKTVLGGGTTGENPGPDDDTSGTAESAKTGAALGAFDEECTATGVAYSEMAEETFNKFFAKYYYRGEFANADFWDNAEIFETVVDAFERTGDDKYKKY